MTAWRLQQDAHAACQHRANLRQGAAEVVLSFIFCLRQSLCFCHNLFSAIRRQTGPVSLVSSADLMDVFSFHAAAVDYLAKNVSLSTQRRMKLGDHSAVLGLLQVETGQAY